MAIEAVRPVHSLVHKIKVTEKKTVRSLGVLLCQKVHSRPQLVGRGGTRMEAVVNSKDIIFLGRNMSQHGSEDPAGQIYGVID